MDVTLVFPGLLDLDPSALRAAEARAPSLGRLLARASSPTFEVTGAVATLCALLGIARARDWPIAPWLARGAGIDAQASYWLCADPVSFAVGQNDVRLGQLVCDLGADESAALLSLLNQHFANDGIRFFARQPSRWLIGASSLQDLETHPPDEVAGQPVLPFLPSGSDAPRWLRWQSEMQMLLFENEVNRQREGAGRTPVNGVWLWGGGMFGIRHGASIAALYADGGLPSELALSTGVVVRPLQSFAALTSAPSASPAAVWMNTFDGADTQQLGSQLAAVDSDWMRPASDALAAQTLRALDLIFTGRRKRLRFQLGRPSLMQRLRRSAGSLGAALGQYLESQH